MDRGGEKPKGILKKEISRRNLLKVGAVFGAGAVLKGPLGQLTQRAGVTIPDIHSPFGEQVNAQTATSVKQNAPTIDTSDSANVPGETSQRMFIGEIAENKVYNIDNVETIGLEKALTAEELTKVQAEENSLPMEMRNDTSYPIQLSM